MGMSDDRIHLFADFTLDLTRGFLLRGDELVHLRPQTYEVLKYLVENRGRLISKDKLIEDVWQGRAVTDGSLGKCIEELREALGENALEYIRNVRGRGYIFDSEPGRGEKIETTSEQIDVLRVVVVDEEKDGGALYLAGEIRKHKFGYALALSVVLLGTVGLGYWFFATRSSNLEQIRSIAVLPFNNESGNPDVEYLSDGMTESLINRLSQLPQLQVIARNSTFEYKGKAVNPQEVSRALGVQAILLGRVVERGDSLVVSVELVNARDRTQVWGERYTRKAADIQVVQEEIARTIAEKLGLPLSGAQKQQLAKRTTQNPQAYELYLNGVFYFRKPGIEGVRKSLDYFNQAVTLDSNFALAWLEVARVNRFFAGNSLLEPKEALAIAKAATQKALELDDTLAEAHLALAGIKKDEWDWAGAEREYTRAIELNPNLAEAHSSYSNYLSVMERHTEALAENKRARELDPLRIGLWGQEADALFFARRYDEAIEKMRQVIEMGPGHGMPHFGVGLMYAGKRMYEPAVTEYQKAISIIGQTTSTQCYLGYALAMSGKRSKAQAILDKLKTTKEYTSPTELAVLYVGLGDKEGAMASLERAYAAHDLQLQTLKIDSHFDTLRSDPRFQDLVRRVGFPA
jgi:TolB-like protein/DNA-binding winged helix-turn-helix (wHTH) protein/Tfp pilus assembly protein PilF